MRTAVILASGPSAQPITVRPGIDLIAVCDAYRLAPSADAIVAQDREWWSLHRDAAAAPCLRYSVNDIEDISPGAVKVKGAIVGTGTNSGALAIYVAVVYRWAQKILLSGFDMNGDHFFGAHPKPLANTTAERFDTFRRQFLMVKEVCEKLGIEVVNCTPDSTLTCFRMSTLAEELCDAPA